ncbi:hypothetical protein GQ54DRAFT_292917 [Martensiomyces pterosporus]|nr:hypothetical protein GQ54DRAFT_292917 [Martensiomyces pterosporus]
MQKSPYSSRQPCKRIRLSVPDKQSQARLECIVREQLDLELYLKQKEIGTITERLYQSEALLGVLESAIRSRQHASSMQEDIADGYLGYFRRLAESTESRQSQASQRSQASSHRQRPRRAAAISSRYTTDSSGTLYAQRVDGEIVRIVPSKAPSRGPRVGALASKLSAEQMSSVADALEFISKPQRPELESSDAESDSSSDGESAPLHAARESRFHVIRRVMLGNTSQYISPEARSPGQESCTHKWTVYLRGMSNEDAVSDYIRRVRVFLHPSYRPDDIVDLSPPKFELTRWGWGEFPVRLQVFFIDRRNKPVDLIHLLTLDDSCSGECVVGAEAPIDFEIDRRGLSKSSPPPEQHSNPPLFPSLPPPPDNSLLKQLFAEICRLCPLLLTDAIPRGLEVPDSPESIIDLVPSAVVEKWTWCVAVSADVWKNSWPLGKRLAAEAQRNRALLSLIASAASILNAQEETGSRTVDTTNQLVDALTAILRASNADDAAAESLVLSIRTADAACCKECLDMLRLWLLEYPVNASRNDKPAVVPNTSRGLHNKSYAWSLKRWLRFNGFAPQPETQAIRPEDGSDRHPKPKHAIRTKRRVRVPVHRYFCHFCGALESRSDPRFSIKNGELVRDPESVLPAISYCSKSCEGLGSASVSTVSKADEALTKLPQGWDASEDEDDGDTLLMIDDDAAAYSTTATPLASRPASPSATNGVTHEDIEGIASALREYHVKQQNIQRDDADDDGSDGSKRSGSSQSAESRTGDKADDQTCGLTDDMGIDWVWSAIRPLELNCAPASRFSSTSTGADVANATLSGDTSAHSWVQLPNSSDETFGEALDQRLVVGRLFFDVAKLFLRDLVNAAQQGMRQNRASGVIQEPASSMQTADCTSGAEVCAPEDAKGNRKLLMLTPLHVLAAVKRNPQAFDACSNAYLADGS